MGLYDFGMCFKRKILAKKKLMRLTKEGHKRAEESFFVSY